MAGKISFIRESTPSPRRPEQHFHPHPNPGMVFLQRSGPPNPRKRPAPVPGPQPASSAPQGERSPHPAPPVTGAAAAPRSGGVGSKGKGQAIGGGGGEEEDQRHVGNMISLLAEAGCTLCVPHDGPPSLPANPHKLRRHLESRLSCDPSLRSHFLSGFSSYVQNPQNLRRVLIPASQDGGPSRGESLVRVLLLVAPIQPPLQRLLLEKLPEYFDAAATDHLSLNDDAARLIINQFRWLDFLVDAEGFSEKLMEVLSISPPQLKKEIIGSLPEIIGDQSHGTIVAALERILQEDSEVIVPVLDSFSYLNLDDQLQEQAVTVAISCIRTVDGEHTPHLLRFLLLSATPTNVRRIISQIREQVKFVGVVDSRAARNKKLKGKSLTDSPEASILDALRSSLRFKNILCEAILKELKSIDQPRHHKVIDVWFLMLIYVNGGSLQKSAEKIFKKKIVEGVFCEALFDQCIHGHRELVKGYFSAFLSVSEYLLACKEQQARDFGIYLYTSLFEEFTDTYSRQEVLGALVTHIGSGVGYEVSSALETMILLTSKYSEELIPISSHINGILDYLEGFHEDNLHKVYKVFCHLALSASSNANSVGSKIANELLMIVRKQVSNPDNKYRKMGIIGTLKMVSTLGDVNAATNFSSSQKSNCEEVLELLQMSLDSCKLETSPLVLLYDELIALLDHSTLQPALVEWIGKHVGEFESLFLADLEGGQLPSKDLSNDMEVSGYLWMNLDGDLSPLCLNILSLLSSSLQQCSSSLQILPSQFSLLSTIERLTNQGSLGGIDALLGCPLHLPSPKYLVGAHWKKLTGKQKKIVCLSLYYAINWMRELLNAFITQVAGRVDCIAQATKDETLAKLLKRLRNLVLLECLLNASVKSFPLSLPELHYFMENSGLPFLSKHDHSKQQEKRSAESTSPNKRKRKKELASEKLDPNGKLKQPTIMDALKRAGAVISQDVSNGSSPGPSSKVKICCDHGAMDSNEFGLVDISAAPLTLESQRFKFRPLHVDCLSMLTFSETQDSCCSDPAAELPLHLYLLRDFHTKLDYLNPPSKQFAYACLVKAPPGYRRIKTSEFLCKIRPVFRSLRRHLDCAFSILKDGSDTCQDHWKSHSSSAGNPDIPCLVVSKPSVASCVFREVLCCYSKLIRLPDILLQTNLPILRDLLEAFQPVEKLDHFFSGIQSFPSSRHIDYLYCGVYSFFEGVMVTARSFSFLIASEVLETLQSVVSSIAVLLDKSSEGNGKNMHVGCSQKILPFLQSRLGFSARELLVHDPGSEDTENGWKSKGDIIQKILQIYLKNSESSTDLLEELACTILPQVPSCKSKSTQEPTHGFPTLCPTMFLTWYRVLHEENLDALTKMVKKLRLKTRADVQQEALKKVFIKLHQSVNVVVSLVTMCKGHDKVAVHAMAVKYGGKFVDVFLKAFDFLHDHFQEHSDIIIQMVRELQKATRIIQTLCSEAKGSKRTMVTSKVPATKRSLERFVFHVKALLHNTSSGCSFWMGNLKHKDLSGHVVSSQVYDNGNDDIHREAENLMEAEPGVLADNGSQGDDGNGV